MGVCHSISAIRVLSGFWEDGHVVFHFVVALVVVFLIF